MHKNNYFVCLMYVMNSTIGEDIKMQNITGSFLCCVLVAPHLEKLDFDVFLDETVFSKKYRETLTYKLKEDDAAKFGLPFLAITLGNEDPYHVKGEFAFNHTRFQAPFIIHLVDDQGISRGFDSEESLKMAIELIISKQDKWIKNSKVRAFNEGELAENLQQLIMKVENTWKNTNDN